MNPDRPQVDIPTIFPRPGDGVPIDISELIRGGVRLMKEDCSNLRIHDVDRISEIPIEEMWNELEKLLNHSKGTQN